MFVYRCGPFRIGVQFAAECKEIEEKAKGWYEHVIAEDQTSPCDHMCTITEWSYKSPSSFPDEDVIEWVEDRLSVQSREYISIQAQWDLETLHTILQVQVGEGVRLETPLFFWEAVQRVSIYPFLMVNHAFLMHGSALLVDGKAFVFLGPHGAGKSTIARLGREQGLSVLTDDTAVMRYEEGTGRLLAYAAPYPSKEHVIGVQGAWPVEQFYMLEQSLENDILPAVRDEFASSLTARLFETQYACQPFRRHEMNQLGNRLMQRALKLTKQYSGKRFCFNLQVDLAKQLRLPETEAQNTF